MYRLKGCRARGLKFSETCIQGSVGHRAHHQAKDPAAAKKIYKAYCKAKDEGEKDRSKIKFTLSTYFEVMESASGAEVMRKGELMWEQEYIEHTKTAKALRLRTL